MADRSFSIGRPIQDSFAIVRAHPSLRGTDILVDANGRYSTANSGALGTALQPSLSSYSERNLLVTALDAPIGSDLGEGSFRLLPAYRSGYRLTVGSDYMVSVVGRLLGIYRRNRRHEEKMGYEMRNATHAAIAILTCLVSAPVSAQEIETESSPLRSESAHAFGVDVFASTDADNTDVLRAGANLDLRYKSPENYLGVRVEKAWYRPLGLTTVEKERVFLRYANGTRNWKWNAQVGTDGDTVIGSVSIHDEAKFRKEFFIERDVVETPRGVREGIYHTFFGAALDLPVDDRNSFTVVAGAQEFTGKNVRLHARANYVHTLKPEWGLSAQLRTRYFHSTEPREYDYYSPRWYVQALPVLQLRQYSRGWRYMVAGGVGAQRDAVSDWRASYYAAAEVTSPEVGRNWYFKAAVLYNNIPQNTGAYDYGQATVSLTRIF